MDMFPEYFSPCPISAPPVHISSAPVQNVPSVTRNKTALPISSGEAKRRRTFNRKWTH